MFYIFFSYISFSFFIKITNETLLIYLIYINLFICENCIKHHTVHLMSLSYNWNAYICKLILLRQKANLIPKVCKTRKIGKVYRETLWDLFVQWRHKIFFFLFTSYCCSYVIAKLFIYSWCLLNIFVVPNFLTYLRFTFNDKMPSLSSRCLHSYLDSE